MSNQIVMQRKLDNGLQLKLVQRDVSQKQVNAIVNAANEKLQRGGGVAVAIAKAGGPIIQQRSNAWVEEHGPLSVAVQAAVEAAQQQACRSRAIPPISTGVFGYPVDQAAGVVHSTIHPFNSENSDSALSSVRIAIIDEETLQPFREAFEAAGAAGK